MQFETTQKELIAPLKVVTGVVEQRQVLPILGNILCQLKSNTLKLTASDNEVEISCQFTLSTIGNTDGEITIPAKKLFSLARSLDADEKVSAVLDENSLFKLKSGKSTFKLQTLPANDFPDVPKIGEVGEFKILQRDLKALLDKTAYAMATNDVRYYLNGVLLEMKDDKIYVVATDGHRLAMAEMNYRSNQEAAQIIIPRKAISELLKLLINDDESNIDVSFDENHIRFKMGMITMTSKLIDGSYPTWEAVIPENADKVMVVTKNTLKQAIQRAIIMANEKYKGVTLTLGENQLAISSHNAMKEEAEDIIPAKYTGEELEIGFNGIYILEAINSMDSEEVFLGFLNEKASVTIKDANNEAFLSVVMPMRL